MENTQTISAVEKKKAPRNNQLKREIRWGWLFLSPWLVGLLVFTLLPTVASLIFSFTSYNPIQPDQIRFIGLTNYARLFTDPFFGQAVGVTLRFVLISVPFSLIIPLGLALLVNSEYLFGKNLYRALFFMPSMIPVAVNVMVWRGIMNSESGWLNKFLGFLSISGPNWFQDEVWVLPALTLMGVWGVGNAMIIMLAGLQNVPTELYDAAKVDGATGWQRFRHVTLPLISPIIFYQLVLSLIGTFQYFTQAYIISNGRGDPNGATMFYNLYLYRTAFNFLDMGYGATLAWVMFAFVLLLTIFLFRTQQRWVYYAGGE
ncbi:MAG: sugar ABC transporter permease [Anaerolineales bacterium]|nr:sugar ABC transporter permease [Anaerolineales bacterium]MCW5854638.1 sugar ABC transporter permease [Anaerolineales bacterium]